MFSPGSLVNRLRVNLRLLRSTSAKLFDVERAEEVLPASDLERPLKSH